MLTPTKPSEATASLRGWHFAQQDRNTRYSNEPIREGKMLSATGPLQLCENGMHASEDLLSALSYAPGPILSLVELSGELKTGSDKVCARYRKHLRIVDITPQLQEFALWCADEVLPIFEKRFPGDNRPRKCIEVTRDFLSGKATRNELLKARSAAYTAYYSAYASAAYSADAASAAAYSADAAYASAAYSAASASAAYSADAASAYAAYSAASAAYAAYAAARKEMRRKQREKILSLIAPLFEGV